MPRQLNNQKLRNWKNMKREILLFDLNEIENSNDKLNLVYMKDSIMMIMHILKNLISFQGKFKLNLGESISIKKENPNSKKFHQFIVSKINKNNEVILNNLCLLCDALDIFLNYSNIANEILKLISISFNLFYSLNFLNVDNIKTYVTTLYIAPKQNNNKNFNKIKQGIKNINLKNREENKENNFDNKKFKSKLLQVLKVNIF